MEDYQSDDNVMQAIESEPEIIYEGEQGYVSPSQEESVANADDIEENVEIDDEDKSHKNKKSRVPAKTRINDLSRKYHSEARRAEKAEIELSKMREENERLKRISENQNKSVVSSQESMVASNILHARQMKAKAIEDGDVEGQVNADEALAAAVAQKHRLEEYKLSQKLYEEDKQIEQTRQPAPSVRQTYEEEEIEATPEAYDWVNENSWFNENSDEFDPLLHQKAFAYAQYLDRDYVRKGKQDRIGTYEYFDDLDRYMSKHLRPATSKGSNQGGLVMSRPQTPVAGVNRSGPSQGGQRERFSMSREEQGMARAMGWTDQQWFNYKKKAEQNEKAGTLKTYMR